MIVTLTPNPSIDRTLRVEALDRGGVNRATSTMVEAAGKGINISRAVHQAGLQTTAVYPTGVAGDDWFARELTGAGVEISAVPVGGPIRTNVTIAEDDGTTTKVNEAGHRMTEAAGDALLAAAVSATGPDTVLAACGSLAPGLSADFFATLAQRLDRPAEQFAVDTSGLALERALLAPSLVVKPNHHELASVTGRPVHTLGEAASAASELLGSGPTQVLVSLGSGGALLVSTDGVWHGVAVDSVVVNTVGAGDATLAGFLAGGGVGVEALVHALAWGRAAVRSPSTLMDVVTNDDMDSVRISADIDTAMVLED